MLIKITRESVKFIGSKVYSRELYKYGIVIIVIIMILLIIVII